MQGDKGKILHVAIVSQNENDREKSLYTQRSTRRDDQEQYKRRDTLQTGFNLF